MNLFGYFNNENNKNTILKIFSEDKYECIIKESSSNKKVNKENRNPFNLGVPANPLGNGQILQCDYNMNNNFNYSKSK